jgi:hypothetical protein
VIGRSVHDEEEPQEDGIVGQAGHVDVTQILLERSRDHERREFLRVEDGRTAAGIDAENGAASDAHAVSAERMALLVPFEAEVAVA